MQSFFTHEGETMKDIKTNGFDIVPFITAQRMEEDGDIERALYAYRYLAEQGEIAAIQKLAVLYHQGEIVEQNFQESVRWLKRGANLNDRFCIFNLARCYMQGTGVEQNTERVIAFLQRSAALGDGDSQLVLAKYYYEEEHNAKLFLYWLKKAIGQHNVYAYAYAEILRERLRRELDAIAEKRAAEQLEREKQELLKKQRDLNRRLNNSWKEVMDIFMEKKLNNKVHFFRGSR